MGCTGCFATGLRKSSTVANPLCTYENNTYNTVQTASSSVTSVAAGSNATPRKLIKAATTGCQRQPSTTLAICFS